jgi:predicted nucleic acid-binding protein
VAEVVLDANVLVAMLDSSDSWARDASVLGRRLTGEGNKRASFSSTKRSVWSWGRTGRLSFNDALLVVLQRERVIDEIATFDSGFDSIPGFRRIH